jgi:hypothetical protein
MAAAEPIGDACSVRVRQIGNKMPQCDELRARLERRAKTNPSVTPAQAVRAERERQ